MIADNTLKTQLFLEIPQVSQFKRSSVSTVRINNKVLKNFDSTLNSTDNLLKINDNTNIHHNNNVSSFNYSQQNLLTTLLIVLML